MILISVQPDDHLFYKPRTNFYIYLQKPMAFKCNEPLKIPSWQVTIIMLRRSPATGK